MQTATTATMSELAEELNRCDIALAIGLSRKEERKWVAYRKAIKLEIERCEPLDATIAAMTDEQLMSELS